MKIDKNMENFVLSKLLYKLLLAGKRDIAAHLIKNMIDDPIF